MTFEEWLNAQEYASNTIASQLSRIDRIRRAYPDLDESFERDAFSSLLREFAYSRRDEKDGLKNPTRLLIDGNIYHSLATYRATLGRYLKYKQGDHIGIESGPAKEEADENPPDAWPGFERHMQRALRLNIGQLEANMQADDDGVERRVDSGFIDITARDATGRLVVIELKTGMAGQRAVAQILSYMGDVAAEEDTAEIRGMLVAFDFDHKAKAAAKMVPSLELVKYGFRFEFSKA